MGANMIIAIVIGAILVIVGFSLWPVLNGANQALFAYFKDSCQDGNASAFSKVYEGNDGALPSTLSKTVYYIDHGIFGGAGVNITGTAAGECTATGVTGAATTDTAYNEQGVALGVFTGAAEWTSPATDDYKWVKVAPMLKRFQGINNLLLTIMPVVSIAGFLGISGAKLYQYGRGAASIGSSISTAIFTLIAIVVAMIIAAPIMGAAVGANQVVVSGQYQVNGTFGNIIALLFSMIPVVYIAGLITLVGLQARSALMGGRGG